MPIVISVPADLLQLSASVVGTKRAMKDGFARGINVTVTNCSEHDIVFTGHVQFGDVNDAYTNISKTFLFFCHVQFVSEKDH